MADFIRIPGSIIDLSNIREVVPLPDAVVIHWHNGNTKELTGLDAAVLLNALEQRYGVMTVPAAQLWEEEEVEIA